ncbi:DedA family protein [Polaromonas jejuensis]|uniref:DedA family protein n=1 Tax=Polaromonas jejuensis TaxID=457502 RepID=A0ABW0Q5B4_9BURK|nr:DedA family protein [Polaromonas jejuensis]
MSLTQLLAQYGYLAVFVGSVLEGETVLVLAGFAAHQGYLSFPLVITLAFCGGTLGDQISFFIGRYYGAPLLSRFPRLASRAQPINQWIQHYQTGLIVGVRFMYGFRIAGPLVIGMSDVSAWRFLLLNLLGAAIWAVLIAGAGYLFGETLQWLVTDLKQYEEIALLLIVVAAVLMGLVHRLYARHR